MPDTPSPPAALLQQLTEARERGYAWDGEEHLEGMPCVAAPSMRALWERLWQFGGQLRATAEQISRRLGGPERHTRAAVSA